MMNRGQNEIRVDPTHKPGPMARNCGHLGVSLAPARYGYSPAQRLPCATWGPRSGFPTPRVALKGPGTAASVALRQPTDTTQGRAAQSSRLACTTHRCSAINGCRGHKARQCSGVCACAHVRVLVCIRTCMRPPQIDNRPSRMRRRRQHASAAGEEKLGACRSNDSRDMNLELAGHWWCVGGGADRCVGAGAWVMGVHVLGRYVHVEWVASGRRGYVEV